jgi:hypothetical protein
VRCDAAQVHPAGTVLDEHQHVYPLQQHGVHVQETDREDPGGLGAQELPPRRAGPAGRRIDARSTQDLPHGGRRDGDAELHELAVDAPVSPQRILPRQADGKAGDARACRRASRLAPLARVVLPRRQPAVPGQQRRWRDGEDFAPAPARDEPRQRGEPGPVSRLVPDPAGVPPQYRVLMPEIGWDRGRGFGVAIVRFPRSPRRVKSTADEVPVVWVLFRQSLPEQGLRVSSHPALQ